MYCLDRNLAVKGLASVFALRGWSCTGERKAKESNADDDDDADADDHDHDVDHASTTLRALLRRARAARGATCHVM